MPRTPASPASSPAAPPVRAPRGFAAMSPERRREVAASGGRAVHEGGRAHRSDPEHMARIGQKGGTTVARDREHMAAIGRKGGLAVARDREHMAEIGRRGGHARHLVGDEESATAAADE